MTEFEFHISPALSSSRPHTGLGTLAATSSSRRANHGSVLTKHGPPTASARSEIDPPRQHRTS
jgi:hypothetical protein